MILYNGVFNRIEYMSNLYSTLVNMHIYHHALKALTFEVSVACVRLNKSIF